MSYEIGTNVASSRDWFKSSEGRGMLLLSGHEIAIEDRSLGMISGPSVFAEDQGHQSLVALRDASFRGFAVNDDI